MPDLPGPPRIALRYPCSAQALGDHCAAQSLLRASPGRPSMVARGTHASRPWSPARRMRLARLKIGVASTPLKVARSA
jgi:hypothetical protein